MRPCIIAAILAFLGALTAAGDLAAADHALPVKVGMIGLDTSHVVAFAQVIRDAKPGEELAGLKIVAAYPGGSRDLPDSWNRVKQYTEQLRGMNVEIVDSIDELLKKVDAVMLESVDGRPHLAQASPVIAAGKPLFIDKPMAASLADAMEIFRLARQKHVPCFSASSLRFSSGFQAAGVWKSSPFGAVKSCVAWSPLHVEPHHPDLFWYGIHGVEILYTIMGPGCKTITRPAPDKVVGVWADGRTGTFVAKDDYGARVEGTMRSGLAGKYEGYKPLVIAIARFFRGSPPPVSAEETLEILAFMEAADASKRAGGAPVSIESVMAAARRQIPQ
jgi:hypothetical protein